jgi:hypothetical protein
VKQEPKAAVQWVTMPLPAVLDSERHQPAGYATLKGIMAAKKKVRVQPMACDVIKRGRRSQPLRSGKVEEDPDHQRLGWGSRQELIRRTRRRGHPMILVIGEQRGGKPIGTWSDRRRAAARHRRMITVLIRCGCEGRGRRALRRGGDR